MSCLFQRRVYCEGPAFITANSKSIIGAAFSWHCMTTPGLVEGPACNAGTASEGIFS
jgi:hypothetical protein